MKCNCSLIFLSFMILTPPCKSIEYSEEEAAPLINEVNHEFDLKKNEIIVADWAYMTNLTPQNAQRRTQISVVNSNFIKRKIDELQKVPYQNFQNKFLRRMFKKMADAGLSVLSENDLKRRLAVGGAMEGNYAMAKLCSYRNMSNCEFSLDPEIDEVLRNSRDAEELQYYWVEWHNKTGAPVRPLFDEYVELNNKAARLNNYSTTAEWWINNYEDDTFEEQVENILNQIRPLYEQIHGYVRHRLRQIYGEDLVSKTGPIPMHLTGNMWAQSWVNVAKDMLPYPNKEPLDVTDEMIKQGYTPLRMFQLGDEFFQSINMTKLPQSFWENSIIEKPTDGRDIICHASATDFYVQNDVRIKMCTRVTMDQFFTVHHELGHIQYFLQYSHLPSVFKDGANDGFHEAVGDTLALSVSTAKHLNRLGLLNSSNPDEEDRINALFRKALDKIVFLPYAYAMDTYRWGIFRGTVKPEEYNCAFWKLRDKYCGVEPPVVRDEEDFDAPAKYHVSAGIEYMRYFVSYIIQFQFYKAACEKAGQYVPGDPSLPLDNCDFHGSIEAGNAFKAMLSLGSSKPWPDAMEAMTGQRRMDAQAIVEYFEPLRIWLENENNRTGAHLGWTKSNKCVQSVWNRAMTM